MDIPSLFFAFASYFETQASDRPEIRRYRQLRLISALPLVLLDSSGLRACRTANAMVLRNLLIVPSTQHSFRCRFVHPFSTRCRLTGEGPFIGPPATDRRKFSRYNSGRECDETPPLHTGSGYSARDGSHRSATGASAFPGRACAPRRTTETRLRHRRRGS